MNSTGLVGCQASAPIAKKQKDKEQIETITILNRENPLFMAEPPLFLIKTILKTI
jgi:hypothetical protein